MAMVINTNIGSLNATRLLDQSSRSQATSMERLTSGVRINNSKDDAAGQSVVTNMTSQVRGLDMAVRNANDGMSMIQTADGALDEQVSMLQRMRELAVQSSNGTYTATQRTAMQAEVTQLNSELKRISDTTKFNGISLLSGTSTVNFQVGWERGTTNKIAFSKATFASVAAGIATAASASTTIGNISTRLQSIEAQRAKWGAVQNRLEYTNSNLQNVAENISASRSRIQDTDYAKEAANLARSQVLQQAGMSMLSQSNANGQNVLSLLR
ncbi:MAG TPA: flagellin [Thiotrichales bacterium]|nr:MAG: flagellin [Thiotrichales bacterium 35-46-9]HQR83045.1 flagellin [Thiotrichales bacterium]